MKARFSGVLAFVCAAVWVSPGTANALRDPTRPPAEASHRAVVHEPPPVLSAVMGADGQRVAIFNGHVVRSGGAVGSYAIEAVFADGVRYRHAGITQELRLARPPTLKKPSTAPARVPNGVQ